MTIRPPSCVQQEQGSASSTNRCAMMQELRLVGSGCSCSSFPSALEPPLPCVPDAGSHGQPLQIVARHREGEPLLLPDRKFDGILPGERRFSVRPVSAPVRCRYSPMQTGPANILRSVFSSFIRFWLNTVPFRRTAKMKRHTPTHTQQSARSPASEVVSTHSIRSVENDPRPAPFTVEAKSV